MLLAPQILSMLSHPPVTRSEAFLLTLTKLMILLCPRPIWIHSTVSVPISSFQSMTVSSSDTLAKVAYSSLISIHLTPLMGPQWPGTFSLCVPLIFHECQNMPYETDFWSIFKFEKSFFRNCSFKNKNICLVE